MVKMMQFKFTWNTIVITRIENATTADFQSVRNQWRDSTTISSEISKLLCVLVLAEFRDSRNGRADSSTCRRQVASFLIQPISNISKSKMTGTCGTPACQDAGELRNLVCSYTSFVIETHCGIESTHWLSVLVWRYPAYFVEFGESVQSQMLKQFRQVTVKVNLGPVCSLWIHLYLLFFEVKNFDQSVVRIFKNTTAETIRVIKCTMLMIFLSSYFTKKKSK